MNCGRLLCTCACGGYGQPHTLWITDQKQLLITCLCIACEEPFNVLFPLADLFKQCPLPNLAKLDKAIGNEIDKITGPLRPPLSIKEPEFTDGDKEELKSLHVSWEGP